MSSNKEWNLQEHSKIKLTILKKYLWPYFTTLGSKHKVIHYVDGFAGRGEYEPGEFGSPVIAIQDALEAMKTSKNKDFVVKFHLIEEDMENFENLESIIKEIENGKNYNERLQIYRYNNTFEDIVNDIMKDFDDFEPSFFFLDPFGYKPIKFESFREISGLYNPEILLTFMVQSISRFILSGNIDHILEELFGDVLWKQEIDSIPGSMVEKIRDLFISRIKNLRQFYSSWYDICRPNQNRIIYYMVHFTTHTKGIEIMRDVMGNIGKEGTFKYHGPRENEIKSTPSLLKMADPTFFNDRKEVEDFWLENLNQQEILYSELSIYTMNNFSRVRKKNIRDLLLSMEKEGKVTISRDAKGPAIHPGDIIRFVT